MLMPSIFGENLFDDFFTPFYYDDKDEKKAEKKLGPMSRKSTN